LEGLQIISVKDKVYDRSSLKPLWGVENAGMNFSQISPLWGIVDAKYENSRNVSTLRSDALWLPGYVEGVNLPINSFMNTPGSHFHSHALRYIYGTLGTIPSQPTFDILGYSGHAQFAMYRKWLELSTNAQDSAKIIDLVWTDIVANAVVGTKGWASEGMNSNAVEVTYAQRNVHYRLVYAIPAMLLLIITLCVLLLTALLVAMQRTGLSKMIWFLDRTSLGRNFTALLYPDVTSQETSTKAWQDRDAQRLVTVSADRPYAGSDSEGPDTTYLQAMGKATEDVESSERFLSS
jgi:hypothetical protein